MTRREVRRRLALVHDRRSFSAVPWLLVGSTALALILGGVLAALVILSLASFRPAMRARRQRLRLGREQLHGLPHVATLLRLAVSGGADLDEALRIAAAHGPPVHTDALQAIVEARAVGVDRATALADLERGLGRGGGTLVGPLRSALRYGTPVGHALGLATADMQERRRRDAEAAARRLPVKMLFPLVLCILPAFILIAFVPLVLSIVSSLDA